MKKIISLLFAALLVLTAFAACSHEEKKPDSESDSYPSYSVNADDMNKDYKLDDIADLSPSIPLRRIFRARKFAM